ncbi:hypothetical protein Agabi119p4_8170 [Agaricus bisporus var. burnettii]|uniref:Uncharacterized protein n=1 Tax=Agaricus bisporus var. burnettii TaxID=192524 RepID=A0A8H7EY69_AGABI|nr:hypothetical protein Agabi119p4_8170 [Agaricus bisporus var. burnettii]
MLGSTSTSALSLYSIPVVWFTAFYPGTLKFLNISNTIGYNNVAPRGNVAKVAENKDVSPALAARIQRMEGAHYNGVENFPLWTAAVLMGNMAGLDHAYLNKMSLIFIATRVLYNQIYINQTNSFTSYIRTFTFLGSISIPLTIMIKAANKMNA